MKHKKIIIAILVLSFSWLGISWPHISQAQRAIDSNFNPNRIIEDSEFLDYSSMSLMDIQNFLQNKGSFLTNYTAINNNGAIKSAAEIIYDASNNNFDCDNVDLNDPRSETEKIIKCRHITTVNPKVLLVLLQKEQGLIEATGPSSKSLDWATGYGCPDGWVCNPYYKGFGKQVNSAALQFLAYMDSPEHYNYQIGQSYAISNTLDPYLDASSKIITVIPQNKATAALYNYTPHVFNGNYNFYILWDRYFPEISGISRIYPSGSVIKALDNPNVWLIENGYRRLFDNWSAFISRFNAKQIVNVTSNDINNYPIGNIIKFANYSVVQTPDNTIYLLVDKEKRPFASEAVFKKIGFNPAEIETASLADLDSYQVGSTITATSTYVTGALLRDNKTNDIYYIKNNTRALVDKILLPIRFPYQKIIETTTSELKNYATTSPLLLNEGTLVKTNNFPTVYLISNGKKRPFPDEEVFTKLNYNYDNVLTVSSQFLYNYNMGDPIQ